MVGRGRWVSSGEAPHLAKGGAEAWWAGKAFPKPQEKVSPGPPHWGLAHSGPPVGGSYPGSLPAGPGTWAEETGWPASPPQLPSLKGRNFSSPLPFFKKLILFTNFFLTEVLGIEHRQDLVDAKHTCR